MEKKNRVTSKMMLVARKPEFFKKVPSQGRTDIIKHSSFSWFCANLKQFPRNWLISVSERQAGLPFDGHLNISSR